MLPLESTSVIDDIILSPRGPELAAGGQGLCQVLIVQLQRAGCAGMPAVMLTPRAGGAGPSARQLYIKGTPQGWKLQLVGASGTELAAVCPPERQTAELRPCSQSG